MHHGLQTSLAYFSHSFHRTSAIHFLLHLSRLERVGKWRLYVDWILEFSPAFRRCLTYSMTEHSTKKPFAGRYTSAQIDCTSTVTPLPSAREQRTHPPLVQVDHKNPKHMHLAIRKYLAVFVLLTVRTIKQLHLLDVHLINH